jgi:hypothetical protein
LRGTGLAVDAILEGVGFLMGIFGFFGKKPPTMMDGLVQSIYGNKPRKKLADLLEASRIACEELLCEIIEYSDVHVLAKKLFDGPMPYSTHDLAISVSLNFFKDADLFDDLKEAQIAARLQVLQWVREGKVVVPLAQAFEEVLYKLYKPILTASVPTSDRQTPNVDEGVSASIEYASDVRNEVEKSLEKAESARLFDIDSVLAAVDAFHKDEISVGDAAAYLLFKLKYEPKTREQVALRNKLVQRFNEDGLNIVGLNPEVFYKLVAVAIARNDVDATVEWFSVLLGMDNDDAAFLHQFRTEARLWIE